MTRRRAPRTIAALAAIGALAVALTACTPGIRSAVRVNADGTVDFAACVPTGDIEELQAAAYLYDDEGDDVDYSTESQLAAPQDLTNLAVGEVIRFSQLPDTWDELEIDITGEPTGVYRSVSHDEVTIGEWFWNDAAVFGIFYTPMVPDQRCELVE